MKAIKGIAISVAIILLAAFMAVMFLPIDTFIAEKSAKIGGYEVPEEYSDTLYRYYYNNLNKQEQLAYRIVYASFLASPDDGFPNQILIPKLSDSELEEMYCALSYDNPELYFLGNKCSMTSIGSMNYFVPQYLMTMDEYYDSWSIITDKVHYILAKLPSNALTEYEKELYLHDYIIQNCEYDESNAAMVFTMYGVLIDGKANCEGYSRTMQYLLRSMDIYNYLAIGNGETGSTKDTGHMWNIVRIDNKFYNLDVTWDDYSVSDFVDYPDNSGSHVYFNMSTEDIKKNHSINDNALWADCTEDSFGYFRYKGIYFKSYNAETERAMKFEIAETLASGYNSVEFAFENEDAFNNAFNMLITKGGMYNIIQYANSTVDNARRVESTSVQYTNDETNLILRFFFIK